MNGTINILKPVGMTSADVVWWIKKNLGIKKVGHTGTLDPGAAGVLPICLGKATRLAEYYTKQKKIYRAELTFGIVTDSQDVYGQEIIRKKPDIRSEDLLRIMPEYIGVIKQIPPMYSAVRKNGKHLYEYARQGMEVEREKREITIYSLRLVEWNQDLYPSALLDIECSKGTYIRTLCHDMGQTAGTGAIMSFLLRTQTGSFAIKDSWTLEEIRQAAEQNNYSFINDINFGLDLPVIELPAYRLKAFKNGLPTNKHHFAAAGIEDLDEESHVQVMIDHFFVGIATWKQDHIYPTKVF